MATALALSLGSLGQDGHVTTQPAAGCRPHLKQAPEYGAFAFLGLPPGISSLLKHFKDAPSSVPLAPAAAISVAFRDKPADTEKRASSLLGGVGWTACYGKCGTFPLNAN